MNNNQPQPYWNGTQWVYRNADGSPYDPFRPAPVPPKKSNKGLLIFFAVVAFFGIVGGCASLLDTDSNTADTSTSSVDTYTPDAAQPQQPVSVPPAEPAPAGNGIGQPVADGKFTFTVLGVRDDGTNVLGDNPYLQSQAQGRYVFVDLVVANTGSRAQTYFPDNQKLVDERGRTYENDQTAWMNLDQPILAEVNPGNSIQTTLVYDMSAGSVPATLQVHDSLFSGGADINLK